MKKLTLAQENKALYTTFIAEYIEYICSSESFISDFKKNFLKHRKSFEQDCVKQIHSRFVSTNSWLMTSFEMFLNYELDKGCLDRADYDKMSDEFSQTLISISERHGQIAQDNDIVHLFVDAFNQMPFSKQIVLCELRQEGKKICTVQPLSYNHAGYYDGVYYFFLPNVLYQKYVLFTIQVQVYFRGLKLNFLRR